MKLEMMRYIPVEHFVGRKRVQNPSARMWVWQFPALIQDGQTLPPPVKFDVEKQDLPKPIRDHYPPSGLDVIENFVKA